MTHRIRVKPIYPSYQLDEKLFRIGAQLGITAEFNDPMGHFWSLVSVLDGRAIDDVVKAVCLDHPELATQDVLDGIDLLNEEGFLESCSADELQRPAVEERFTASINYFSHFTDVNGSRYSVHNKLRSSTVLLLGLGGAGSNILSLLSGIGVGRVIAVDYDRVERSNLGRQLLYRESDIGRHKALAAAQRIREMNLSVDVLPWVRRISSPTDVADLLDGVDLIVSAIDEPPFTSQRNVNAAAVAAHVTTVYSVSQITRGRIFSVIPERSGCFDCMNIYYSMRDAQFVRQFAAFRRARFDPPSIAYAPAIFYLTSVVVDEAARLLTGYSPPRSVGTQFEVNYVTGTGCNLLEWPRLEHLCPTCGIGSENDWEIFQHYEATAHE